MTPEEQRDDEERSIERAQKAHQRASLDELDAARAEDKAARADMDRILDEIRSGKRR